MAHRMVKRAILVFLLVFSLPDITQAQSHEFGFSIGASNFWGDLGGANRIGRPLFFDLEIGETRPVLGFTYRYNFDGWKAIRFNIFYASVGGNDDKIDHTIGGDEEFRRYRNLNFKSDIIELSTQIEINLMRYEIGRRRYRFAPYVLLGIGGFYFNPKDQDTGVKLQPLSTEGQGFNEYPDRKPYSLVQVAALIGAGIKYNVNEHWSLGFEYGHRLTWTDYIDDVSKNYVDESLFYKNMTPGQASIAYAQSVQSGEILDPDDFRPGIEYSVTVGQQRGDPADNDHYIFAGLITLTYTIVKGKIYCPKF